MVSGTLPSQCFNRRPTKKGVSMRPLHFPVFFSCCLLLAALVLGCGGDPDKGAETVGKTPSPQPHEPMATGGRQPALTESENRPHVVFETSMGRFTVELHRDKVQRTVDNFLRYVDTHFYDGTLFHEVIANYAVVGGGYTLGPDNQKLIEKQALESIRNESDMGLSNVRGTIAMAREPDRADSARCQFFINLRDNTSLDYTPEESGVAVSETAGYCAFGQVIEGIEVLDKIGDKPVEDRNGMPNVPVEAVVIRSIRRL